MCGGSCGAPLGDEKPKYEGKCDPKKGLVKKLFLFVLCGTLLGALVQAPVSHVEVGGKESEGKSSDTEGHVETSPGLAASEPEAREGIAGGGF